MSSRHCPTGRSTAGDLLHSLVFEARLARRRRHAVAIGRAGCGSHGADGFAERRRAIAMLEAATVAPRMASVDASAFLNRLLGRAQLASSVVTTLFVRVEDVLLERSAARALAAALLELLHFVEAGVPAGGRVRIYLAVAVEGDALVVALGADGDFRPVAPAGAMKAMLRGAAIVRALGGVFERGVGDGRMVFGLVFGGRSVFEAST